MAQSSAARTNLTSYDVRISSSKLGEGHFRVCVAGTFVGGNRNGQAAACKRFKPIFRGMEREFFAKDFQIADRAIRSAEKWNTLCDIGKEIVISRGSLQRSRSGIQYLVEPLIRDFRKFTSNGGWIGDTSNWRVQCMEAFTHFTYAESRGQLIVCDLQGRYKLNRYSRGKSRFELGDPAICSRRRVYGPTDLGEKGIDSFFANHVCSSYCKSHWPRPRNPTQWFPRSQGTSMVSSELSSHLLLKSRTTFLTGLPTPIIEEDSDDSDSW
eukprot:scaffold1525_cov142-Cylindrotheca_fusiformis.AAC.30